MDLGDQVLGRQRLEIQLVSLIVTLREVGRLPVRTIQWYLETLHDLHLSVGTITTVSQRVATAAQPAVEAIRDTIRGSPAVHADETGWRTDGTNGYIGTFSTPQARYFTYGRRTKDMVDTVLGDAFAGVLCSDFYAAYTHYPGLKCGMYSAVLRRLPACQAHRRTAEYIPHYKSVLTPRSLRVRLPLGPDVFESGKVSRDWSIYGSQSGISRRGWDHSSGSSAG